MVYLLLLLLLLFPIILLTELCLYEYPGFLALVYCYFLGLLLSLGVNFVCLFFFIYFFLFIFFFLGIFVTDTSFI